MQHRTILVPFKFVSVNEGFPNINLFLVITVKFTIRYANSKWILGV